MEIILTVLITLMVVALIGAGINLFRLSKKVQEIENLKLLIEDQTRERETIQDDIYRRFDEWNSSIDRRFDSVWNKVNKLDLIINPNQDILKGI